MKLFKVIVLFCVILSVSEVAGQEAKTKNIIVITLDGYRWEEIFEGADPEIIFNDRYVKDEQVREQFMDSTAEARRRKLMPFFWNVIDKQGQLYGNRRYRNRVNCANLHLISYPGYSEMLVGFTDPSVSSNALVENPNYTVLEFINSQAHFRNKVAAFATWKAFPYILREERSGIPVNAITETERNVSGPKNSLKKKTYSDPFTFQNAFDFLKREKPRILFISFDATDAYAHAGRYDQYLQAAHATDERIAMLWKWIQSEPGYKDQTTLLIATDHGRGKGKNNWRDHKLLVRGSGQTWFAVIGPDTPAFGEMKFKAKYFQKQLAKTIASFLGLSYKNVRPVGKAIQTMIAVPQPLRDQELSSF